MRKNIITCSLICSLVFSGCSPVCNTFEPVITYTPNICNIKYLPEGFPELTDRELATSWGRELLIGQEFTREEDYYRAITALKRAKFLLPSNKKARLQQIDYTILLAYYLGNKQKDVVEIFEGSSLYDATPAEFPLYDDLLVMLYDSYTKMGKCEKAERILFLIQERSPDTSDSLHLYEALNKGNICEAYELTNNTEITDYLDNFRCHRKSVEKARTLNAVLPGAGYYYVGQKKTALTSFLMNALFIGAACSFFHKGNIAAGLITLSFETGWYFGGINGAGIAAREYNQRLYEVNTKELMYQQRLFPIFHFTKSF